MKAIGVILTAIIGIILVGIPSFAAAYVMGSTRINLIEESMFLFIAIFFVAGTSSIFWAERCEKFYKWFKSNLK